jgi:hypothetical protein
MDYTYLQGLLRVGDDRVSTNAECSVTRHSNGLVDYSGLRSVLLLDHCTPFVCDDLLETASRATACINRRFILTFFKQ